MLVRTTTAIPSVSCSSEPTAPRLADRFQIPRAARCLATAVSQSDPAGPSKPRRFPKLDDGLTFGDFASGQELPTERVVLGNTSQ
jgi:hypothetical protein